MIGSRWRITDNGTWSGLECDFQPMCHFCGSPMEARNIKLFRFPLNEEAYWTKGEVSGHAVDVIVDCVGCGYRKMFGVAVAREDWWKLHHKARREHAELGQSGH